jgi:hypothetical protein
MESHDVQVTGAASASPQGYEYVARRPLAVVALAEARGIEPGVAHAAIERLADQFDACATEEGRRGTLVDGAARVVAEVDGQGSVTGTSVRVGSGEGVVQNAVVCLVAPMKLLAFPPSDAGARGMAVEAIWGKLVGAK